jgi:hypothetical protein
MAGSTPFELGRIYNRQHEIHDVYGGQKYGGIATPAAHPFVLVFSSDEGANFGYADEGLPDGGLIYYGEGQVGDMHMIRGNLAIRDHKANGRALYLFREDRPAYWQYAASSNASATTPGRTRQTETATYEPRSCSNCAPSRSAPNSSPSSRTQLMQSQGSHEAVASRSG